jgi:WD40 repeat protein
LNGHTDWVNSLVILPDNTLASGSADQTIKIWDTVNGKELVTMIGHTSWINFLVVLPDNTLASASADQTIKIWGIKNVSPFFKRVSV